MAFVDRKVAERKANLAIEAKKQFRTEIIRKYRDIHRGNILPDIGFYYGIIEDPDGDRPARPCVVR